MSLSKKAQWIVWDGRKHGIDAETILARCEEKGVTDSREDLLKAISSRPYKAQPTRTYAAQNADPLASIKALLAQVTDAAERKNFEEVLEAKMAERKAKQEADAQAALLAKIQNALAAL